MSGAPPAGAACVPEIASVIATRADASFIVVDPAARRSLNVFRCAASSTRQDWNSGATFGIPAMWRCTPTKSGDVEMDADDLRPSRLRVFGCSSCPLSVRRASPKGITLIRAPGRMRGLSDCRTTMSPSSARASSPASAPPVKRAHLAATPRRTGVPGASSTRASHLPPSLKPSLFGEQSFGNFLGRAALV